MANNTREDLLDRIHAILLMEPRSLRKLAQEIGVQYQTFSRIWRRLSGANPLTWYTIERWIVYQEQRLGIDGASKS